MTATQLTPARLWKTMTQAQRLTACQAFWHEEQAADEQLQAMTLIAQQKKFRAKTVLALDPERKSRYLASILSPPETVAARVLVAYHLAEQRPMMGAFLDAVGISHENGLIKDESPTPDAGKIAPAAAELVKQYPVADVVLYLNTLLCQDPETWGGLSDVVKGLA